MVRHGATRGERLKMAVAVAVLVGAVALSGGSASAAKRHHHHKKHHHRRPQGQTTPSGEFVGCFPAINPVQIQGNFPGAAGSSPGDAVTFIYCRNLNVNETLVLSSPSLTAQCQGVASLPPVITDTQGDASARVQGGDATHLCTPGTVTVRITEVAIPSRSFEVSLTLVA